MARKIIDVGTIGNDGTGDSIRDSFRKVNDNFRELYSSLGLGERLSFIGLADAPDSYIGVNNATSGATPILTVNNSETGVQFKNLVAGTGISIDWGTNSGNDVVINSIFADVSGDPSPQLGGDLSARFGGDQKRILDLAPYDPSSLTPGGVNIGFIHDDEAISKAYADAKVALAGVDFIDPATNTVDTSAGRMTGPLVLSRDPTDEDDIVYDGMVAATKRYVDNSSFGSQVNLYVATSGLDDRPGLSRELQGRALSYAYRTIEAALKRAEELVLQSRFDIGPYKKVLTFGGNVSGEVLVSISNPTVFTSTDHKLNEDAQITFSTSGALPLGLYTDTIYYVLGTDLTANTFKVSTSIGGDPIATTGTQSGIHRFRGINTSRNSCTLTDIDVSPDSGTGFAAKALMSADVITVSSEGSNYRVGDVLTFDLSGTIAPGGEATRIEVLGVGVAGNILTFRVLSSGVYIDAVPGSVNVAASDNSEFGQLATFDITYKVNNVYIDPANLLVQSGYSLVSVRITGGGGSGAFGTAVVETGVITAIIITDPGSGFTSVPTVEADLPRFLIRTDNYRTDFTGDVVNDTPQAIRGRDLREGLFIRGETSGAIAQILSHNGELDGSGNEIFDVDIVYGKFENGEVISYGDVTKNIQVSILVESGIYEENYPLRVPQNVAIIGDEFRRVIIKPRAGSSSSPWAFGKFRRDTTIDSMSTAVNEFGWHYLTDPEEPVYPKIDNPGHKDAAAALLDLNRTFLQSEMVAWINHQITTGSTPFTTSYVYNQDLCKRDYGLIVDAIVFDMKYSGYNRTISAALKYYQNASGLIAIGPGQILQALAALDHFESLMIDVISNTEVTTVYQTTYPQLVDQAYISETNSDTVVSLLVNTFKDIIDESSPGYGSVNQPKNNDELDVFLCNDANIIRAVTCQGHGGFMMVLDPEGQILTKSPYAQECASFSKSIDRQTFAGGQFVDGFAGNLQFQIQTKLSPTKLVVTGLDRYPNLPCSFIVADTVYRVNYVRDWIYDAAGSTATLVLDNTTPWPYDVFTYNSAVCSRDVGYIIEGLTYDMVFGTNYNTRKAGLTYRQANAAVVIEDQKDITVRAIEYAHDLVNEVIFGTGYAAQQDIVESSKTYIARVVDRGTFFAPAVTFTNPTGLDSNIANAKTALLDNIDYIKDETVGWINYQVSHNTSPFTSVFTYESQTCARDVGYIVEALVYDLLYGGNSATRDAGLKYYDGVDTAVVFQATGQVAETAAALTFAKTLIDRVVQNLGSTGTGAPYSATPRIAATPTSAGVRTTISGLLADIIDIVTNGVGNADALTLPSVTTYTYDSTAKAARTAILAQKASIQSQVVDWVDFNGNLFELLMPGNRSMLANDFTQVNDMGYGIVATNGGLIEAVSMFTYYNYISYYSINGGQIRSVAGSSAHGVYALVAEGSDPLEVPTPTEIYFDLNQRVDCYVNSAVYGSTYANIINGLEIYVYNYDQLPVANSELEVHHNSTTVTGTVISFTSGTKTIASSDVTKVNFVDAGFYKTQTITVTNSASNNTTFTISSVSTTAIVVNESVVTEGAGATVTISGRAFGPVYRYPITAVATAGLPTGVAKLTLTSDSTGNFDGLYEAVPHDTLMTLRSNSQITLTGDLSEVAVRPSTGLRLVEAPDTVYRVLQFDTYSDTDGPYTISVSTGTPGVFRVTTTVTTIASNVCTTSRNHKLKIGDKFIPTSTANGFTANQTYYIISVPAYNQFKVSATPNGSSATLTNGTGLTIVGTKSHKLLDNYTITFSTSGTLPTGIDDTTVYYVSADDLTDTTFKISDTKNGSTLAITSLGSGTHSYIMSGLTQTTLRENYDYVEFTIWEPSGFESSSQTATSISIASPAVITKVAHGLVVGDAIKFTTAGTLPTGLTDDQHYFVLSDGYSSSTFKVSLEPEGTAINTSGGLTTGHSFGKIKGHVGGTSLDVVPLGTTTASRVVGSIFMWKGKEYSISQYDSEAITGQSYATITLSRALEDNIISLPSAYTLKAAVPPRTVGATGSLTIRIALTRVTGHDLLEIGTGSYADTNYPNEIYGPSVNALNDANEVEERDVGRAFYVTTDQFGNFNVGPYFRVDQGTGRVTFSAAIALSNLDGIGFKRGVPISEFSTDSAFADNATDTVPTENAARIYVERRLGITHGGAIVPSTQLIPAITGGFMSLDGQLAMKSDMDLDNNRIVNVGNPSSLGDAVNLGSLTFDNFQDFTGTNIEAGDVIVFTGPDKVAVNATIVGDVTFDLRPGVDSALNQVDVQIAPDVILNADVNSSAGIEQSKLSMTLASTRASAPTGTAAQKQAASGLASFDETEFTITDGFVTLKTNGTSISSLEKIGTTKVLGNPSTTTVDNVSAVDFSTVVNLGGAVKKSDYVQGAKTTGFLRKTGGTTDNPTFDMVEATASYGGASDNSKLIIRDSNGDFASRIADLQSLKIDGYTVIDTAAAGGGGYVQYYGYNTANAGVLIQTSSVTAENVTQYRNRQHDFLTANGATSAPITASSIQVQAITTGNSITPGTITGRWTLTGTSPNESRLQATYSADLAEYYEGDKEYEVGTVLVFGGDKEVTLTGTQGDTRVAGVVSNTAAFVMYDACPGHKNLVALQGRVPCRVVGKINKGDMLVTSKIPGVAVAGGDNIKVGTVVGKALVDYDSDHIGTIEIAVGRT